MAGITKEERDRRRQEAEEAKVAQRGDEADSPAAKARLEAKRGEQFGGTAYADLDDAQARLNEIDERLEDRRPGTLRDRDSGEAFEDNRQFAGDLGKAANQMIGRTFITENPSPHPYIDNPGPVAWPNPQDPKAASQEGEEVLVLRGYQPHPAKEGDPLPEKIQAGTVTRLDRKEAKKLVNIGAAKFTEEDAD
jgi:hypothetical protein